MTGQDDLRGQEVRVPAGPRPAVHRQSGDEDHSGIDPAAAERIWQAARPLVSGPACIRRSRCACGTNGKVVAEPGDRARLGQRPRPTRPDAARRSP